MRIGPDSGFFGKLPPMGRSKIDLMGPIKKWVINNWETTQNRRNKKWITLLEQMFGVMVLGGIKMAKKWGENRLLGNLCVSCSLLIVGHCDCKSGARVQWYLKKLLSGGKIYFSRVFLHCFMWKHLSFDVYFKKVLCQLKRTMTIWKMKKHGQWVLFQNTLCRENILNDGESIKKISWRNCS